MPRRCERPGCSAPAEVAYGFDLDRVIVWLEAVDPDDADRVNAGVLCRRHADALHPPRGWFLDDRRDPCPRLFRPAEDATPAGGHPRGEPRPRRARTLDTTEELPLFTATSATGTSATGTSVAVAAPAVAEPAGSGYGGERGPRRAADDDDHRLQRAMEDTDALAWTPVFDHADDLGGILNARSPLLARAFGNRGRPR